MNFTSYAERLLAASDWLLQAESGGPVTSPMFTADELADAAEFLRRCGWDQFGDDTRSTP